MTQPPLGIMPRWLWLEQHPQPAVDARARRVADLEAAIRRYRDAGLEAPPEWAAELQESLG